MKFVHLGLLVLGACLAFFVQAHCLAQTQPSVVLILSDDQAWTDYSCMGTLSFRRPTWIDWRLAVPCFDAGTRRRRCVVRP